MASVDEIIAAAVPRTETVDICSRQDIVERHAAAVAALEAELVKGESLADSVQERFLADIAAIEAEQAEQTISVRVHSVGADRWADILRTYPPGRGDRGMLWNPRTFPPVAVAACSDLTPAQSEAIFQTFPAGEWSRLFVTVLSVNEGALPHPFLPAATELAPQNETSSTTPDLEGSLGEASSVGSGAQ